MAGRAVVAGKLRHGKAGVAVLILHHMVAAGQDLALDDILRVGDGVLLDGNTGDQLHGMLPKRARDGEFVKAKGRRGRLKAARHGNRRIHTDGDGDGQRNPQLSGPFGHGADVAGAGLQEDGQLVFALDTHAVDGHIGKPGVRVRGIAHAERDVRSRVHRRIGWRGHQFEEVKVRVGSQMHHLLTRGGAIHDYRLDGIVGAASHQMGQLLFFAAEEPGHAFAAGHHADHNAGVGMSFDVVKEHGRAVDLRGPLDRAARTHIAVYAGKLRRRIDLDLRLNELPRLRTK